jgi:hypothetical protein
MFFNESANVPAMNIQPTNIGITPDLAGGYRIISETTEQWFNLREKMMRLEHSAIVNEDQNLLSEGVSEFFNKIVNIFKSIVAKLGELWKGFVAVINKAIMSDKDFIKRYGEEIRKRNTAGFKYQGYPWTGLDKFSISPIFTAAEVTSATADVKNATPESVAKFKEFTSSDEKWNELRGYIVGGKVTASDFVSELGKKLRGADEKSEQAGEANKLIGIVSNAAESITKAEKAKADADKWFNSVIKHFESVASSIDKGVSTTPDVSYAHGGKSADGEYKSSKETTEDVGKGAKGDSKRNSMRDLANAQAEACRKTSSITMEAFSVFISAIKERRNECRGAIAKLVTYKPKSEGYQFSEGGLLDRY